MSEQVTMPASPMVEETAEERAGPVDWLTASAERELQKDPAAGRQGALLGPVKVIHAFWLA